MIKLLLLSLAIIVVNSVIFSQTDNWQTYFEKTNYLKSPLYDETIEYFKRIDEISPFARMNTIGISPQGRELKCMIVSKDKAFTPAGAKQTGKPVILVVNGIHSGEIEGKDASMLLLREILVTKEKEWMIENVILLIIPVFNVDGHENMSRYNRINQNGPEEMGKRTTAHNLNLNRDWLKADSPEMQSLLKLFSEWLPDFLIDNHTTNGADYQYTITYGIEKSLNIDGEIGEWVREKFIPFITKKSTDAGYNIFPYVAFRNWREGFKSGVQDFPAPPRFSTGFAAAHNRPALLAETHMLKPFKDRVFATKVIIESVIEYANFNSYELITINRSADKNTIEKYAKHRTQFPINLKLSAQHVTVPFEGITWDEIPSNISGTLKKVYTGRDTTFDINFYNNVEVADYVSVPKGYFIPKEYENLVERLKLHGVEVSVLNEDEMHTVSRYRFSNVKLAGSSYEGRQRASFDIEEYREQALIPAGTFFVATNQRTLRVILHLLEPVGEDSFIKWGFMNAIFEQKEYFESYVMEKIAEEMLADDPALLREFENRLNSDEEFRNNPYERLNFFYKRSPYWDSSLNVYPVMRLE